MRTCKASLSEDVKTRFYFFYSEGLFTGSEGNAPLDYAKVRYENIVYLHLSGEMFRSCSDILIVGKFDVFENM